MKLSELLTEYKEKANVSNEFIAQKVGVNRATVSRWIKDDTKVMKHEVVEKLSYLLGRDVDALLSDKNLYQRPVLGEAKAGYNHLAEQNFEYMEGVSKEDYYKGDYFLRITGDSMDLAHIHNGDLIFVKECNDVPSGSIAVVLIGDDATVKKVIKKADLLILEAANPNIETKYFTSKEVNEIPVKIIGKVLYSRTDF